MYSTQFLRLLLVALSIISISQAAWPEHGRAQRGVVVKRQEDTSDDPSRTTTTSRTPTNPPGDDDQTSTTTDSDDSTTSPTTTPTRTTDEEPEPTQDETTSEEPITETHTQIITTTNADGERTSYTTKSTVTKTPGLSEGDGSSASGMTTETRNIVIGVVVGVGGAIVLGALGFVAWRIWGRKKQAEEQDNLMNYGGVGPADKSEAGTSPPGTMGGAQRNPFQQTLETYHAPTHVNASSNF